MRNALVIVLLLLAAPLAGCLGDDEPSTAGRDEQADPTRPPELEPQSSDPTGPFAVIAFIDSGINPYHADFRDHSPRAFQHPSTYLEDYPEDAVALELTFDHDSLEDAVAADCEAWSTVEPGPLYWVPGTRIVGMVNPVGGWSQHSGDASDFEFTCEDIGEAWPPYINGGSHGTMVASRGAGNDHGACSECLIVAVQGCCPFNNGVANRTIVWAADQPWIDAQSNSWGLSWPMYCQEDNPDERCGAKPSFVRAVEDAASRQPAFWASGNGVTDSYKIPILRDANLVGDPSQLDPRNTPSVVRVGGHDSGYVEVWTGWSPTIVSDACWSWAAEHESMNETTPRTGGGTSAATPYAAGTAAMILLEARRILDHDATGVHDGVVAEGEGGDVDAGPLADGSFTLEELERVLYTTAEARPDRIEEDGDACLLLEPEDLSRWGESRVVEDPGPHFHTSSTLPVPWNQIPDGPAGIPIIGYGAVTPATAEHAFQVLRGEEMMPDRPQADAYFAADSAYRESVHEIYTSEGSSAEEGRR